MVLKLARYVVPLLAYLTTAGPSIAGEFVVSANGRHWRSTECVQPAAPVLTFSDAQSLNAAMSRLNVYTEQIKNYNACLSQEAERDMNLIVQDLAEIQRAAVDSVNTARQQITQSRQ